MNNKYYIIQLRNNSFLNGNICNGGYETDKIFKACKFETLQQAKGYLYLDCFGEVLRSCYPNIKILEVNCELKEV